MQQSQTQFQSNRRIHLNTMSSELKVHVSVSVIEQEIQQLPPEILRCVFFPSEGMSMGWL